MATKSVRAKKRFQPDTAKLGAFDDIPEVPGHVLRKIERATGMRPQTLDIDWMIVEFHFVGSGITGPSPAQIRNKLTRLLTLLRTLRTEMDALPYGVKQSVGIRKLTDDYWAHSSTLCEHMAAPRAPVDELDSFLMNCTKLELAIASTHEIFRRGRGAPRKGEERDKYRWFDSFVKSLVGAIEAGGGEATVNPNTGGSGTLVEALTELAPYLPAGAIPGFLSNDNEYSTEGLARVARLRTGIATSRADDSTSVSLQMDKK